MELINNESFEFARPLWFLAIIPIVLGIYFVTKQVRSAQAWNKHIAPELLSKLTDQQVGSSSQTVLSTLVALTALLIIFALAGPSFKSNQVDAIQTDDTLVVILDLSLSMMAEDIKPSRLQRVKFKLQDILEQRKTGHTALIVYSGDAHVVVPLTEDTETIQHLSKSLNPWMIPSKGSRLYRAIEEANKLLDAYPSSNSRILLFTDEVSESQLDKSLSISKHPTYVVGVGTSSGAPIPLPDKKLLKDNRQNIIVAKFDADTAKQLAASTKASYHDLSIDDSDISGALNFEPDHQQKAEVLESLSALKDFGYLVLIPAFFLFLMTFRKGWFLVLGFILIQPEPIFASTPSNTTKAPSTETSPFEAPSIWTSLWQNQQQQAQAAYDRGDYQTAAELFDTPLEKGNALTKANQLPSAEEQFAKLSNATGLYNLANIQAQQGKLPESLKNYDLTINQATKENNQAVKERAQKDKKILEQLLDQQAQQDQKNNEQQNNQGDQSQENESGQQNQSSDNQSSGNQNSDSQSDEQQNTQNQESEASNSENQSAENQEQQTNPQDQPTGNSDSENQQANQDQASPNEPQSMANEDEEKESASLDEHQAQEVANSVEENNQELTSAQREQQTDPENEQANQGIHDYQATQSTEPLSQDEIEEQKYQQMLRKIQTDPSVLLQNKFKIQHYQRNQPEHEAQVW